MRTKTLSGAAPSVPQGFPAVTSAGDNNSISITPAAILLAGLTSLWSLPATAVHTERYPIPYFGLGGQYLITDSVRESDNGEGFQLTFGVPLESGTGAVELRIFNDGYVRSLDGPITGAKNYQKGIFVNYVKDWGPINAGDAESFFSAIKPFATAGVGFVEEDVFDDKHLHLGLNAGGGLLVPIPFNGWALRLEGLVQAQANDETCPEGGSTCSKAASSLIDYMVNVGIQIPMTLFFDRPVAIAPAEDCPVAVVDPESGRRDCSTDSDRDGIGDTVDECPGTPSGTPVNSQGCARIQLSSDTDGDGVENESDACPGTQPGLKVDPKGCVVEQNTSLRGVTFQPNSARLTPEGQRTLDGVAETLKGQQDLKAEIAGHTDSLGSEAYNTLLSQQRADSVRAYLIGKGVDGGRLTAVGYGELEPVTSNDTDEGRRSNRRVEFRISTH